MSLKARFSKGSKGNIRLDQLKVVLATDKADKEQWNKWIEEHHYLENARLCGPQLRYAVTCRGKTVALVSFSIASWHLAPRDKWLGRDERQRLSRLNFIAQNSRFLIMPGVKTPNLASKSLSMCLGRLTEDWMEHYNQPLLLVETFVEKCYPGTSYRADNWTRLGDTLGFGRGGKAGFYTENESPKTLWVKELRQGAAAILGSDLLPDDLAPYERKLEVDEQARVFTAKTLDSLFDVFNSVPDPRSPRGRSYRLASCLAVLACGLLTGCEGISECADFGKALKPAQMRELRFPYDTVTRKHSAPSHTTLWRVISSVDPVEFEELVAEWYNSPLTKPPKAYAIDGKTLCGSADDNGNQLHVVSAISHDQTPFFFRKLPTTRARRAKPPATS